MQVNRNDLTPTEDENGLLMIKEDDEEEETEEDEEKEEVKEMEEDEEDSSNESGESSNESGKNAEDDELDELKKTDDQPSTKPKEAAEKSDVECHSRDRDDHVPDNINEGDQPLKDIQRDTHIKSLEEKLKKAAEREKHEAGTE